MFYMVFKNFRARQASRLELLREATEDALHQDARCGIMPHIRPMVAAAVAAGAHGAPPRRRKGGLCGLSGGRELLRPLWEHLEPCSAGWTQGEVEGGR